MILSSCPSQFRHCCVERVGSLPFLEQRPTSFDGLLEPQVVDHKNSAVMQKAQLSHNWLDATTKLGAMSSTTMQRLAYVPSARKMQNSNV